MECAQFSVSDVCKNKNRIAKGSAFLASSYARLITVFSSPGRKKSSSSRWYVDGVKLSRCTILTNQYFKKAETVDDINIKLYNRLVGVANAIYDRKRDMCNELSCLEDDKFEGKIPDREMKEENLKSCLVEYDYIMQIIEGEIEPIYK